MARKSNNCTGAVGLVVITPVAFFLSNWMEPNMTEGPSLRLNLARSLMLRAAVAVPIALPIAIVTIVCRPSAGNHKLDWQPLW
jgi:hypothetical protein